MDEPDPEVLRRALGTVYGLAIGDALGMPTQLLSRLQITERYGDLIGDFAAGPPDHAIAAGRPAGTVTDDTEQAVLLGRLLVDGGGRVDPDAFAAALVAWEREMAGRGSLDLLGPSSREAIAALASGVAAGQAGRRGTTNGAAMRIAPVGIATPPAPASEGLVSAAGAVDAAVGTEVGSGRWAGLVDQVVAVSSVTHHTGIALSGAAAVAAAVSAGVDGEGLIAARAAAVQAARLAAGRGYWAAGADVAARIEWAARLVAGAGVEAAMESIVTLVGTSLATQESVPAAFAVLAAVPDDPWLAVRVAASLGGDTDTIAAMVGAMVGAVVGIDAWPEPARHVVDANRLHLRELTHDLLRLRSATAHPDAPAPAALGEPRSDSPEVAPAGASVGLARSGHPSPSGIERSVPCLVFVGEAVVDVTAWVAAAPPRGGDVVARAAMMTPGGGFNVMAAAARQGMAVVYAGRHGTGPAGDSVRRALDTEGIVALRPVDPDADTGFVVTTIEPDGERTFVTAPAALMAAGATELSTIPVRPGDMVYVSGYGLASSSGDDLVGWLVALDPGVTVVADPGPLVAEIAPHRLDAALARTDWWSCNRREATVLSAFDDPARSAHDLAGRRPSGGVIVRTGPQGCLVADRARSAAGPVVVAAPAVEVVDTTGAGDTHVGVFVAGLGRGLTPLAAAWRANVAAALSVTRRGPATAPTRAEVDRWLHEHPDDRS